jgi:hypothetical protein
LFGELCSANVYDIVVDGYIRIENEFGQYGTNIGSICGRADFYDYVRGATPPIPPTNITNCISYCDINITMDTYPSYQTEFVGGICGTYYGNGEILNCKNYGNINTFSDTE